MASVTLSGIKKTFGNVAVIERVDLEIRDGEFITLVGPSGCGKSTLLRMVAGLEEASGGDILIGEERVNDMAPKDRDVAMVFQSYALYPHMSVHDNMGFALKLKGQAPESVGARVSEVAGTLSIGKLLDRLPRQLSGGQRQRTAMGRAIVRQPRVFLFDEPLSNLDAKLRVQMRAEIKKLHHRLGTTSIYVTHDQVEAMTMSDRIVVMEGGHIRQIGRPLEVYAKPADTFVATFIGSPSMNLLPAVVEAGADGRLLARAGERGLARLPAGCQARLGQKVLLGVRPENLSLGGGADRLSGSIVVVEPTGPSTYLVVDVGGESVTAAIAGVVDFAPGAPVELAIDPAHIHIFDAEGGKRL